MYSSHSVLSTLALIKMIIRISFLHVCLSNSNHSMAKRKLTAMLQKICWNMRIVETSLKVCYICSGMA